MGANFDVTPGVLVLGDALGTRHPVTAVGMTILLKDICYWWEALSNVNDLSKSISKDSIRNKNSFYCAIKHSWI